MKAYALATLALLCGAALPAVEPLPELLSGRPVVSIREGEVLKRDVWRLAPEVAPDVYEVEVPAGGKIRVAFESDVGALAFDVRAGESHDFVIRHGEDRCATRLVGLVVPPAALFDDAYQHRNAGLVTLEVPEIYELVNVAIALTATGTDHPYLVYRESAYYREVRAWFDPFRDHPAIRAIEAALRQNLYLYSDLKMNGYAFVFDGEGRIVQSPVYDRTSFPGQRNNPLRPFVPQLQDFADASRFREFYAGHRGYYEDLVCVYRHDVGIDGMMDWLRREFPRRESYDCWRVIFSPLVSGFQSATWLESRGFREVQAHVNFPFPGNAPGPAGRSAAAEALARGAIVFTEFNHGFINPEADRYAERILAATAHRECWVDPARGPGYYGGIGAFNEYMNWALVSLRAVDLLPAEEQETFIAAIERGMTRGRGFPRFAAFDAFLVARYRSRAPGETVADLYPEIIAWFEAQDGRLDPLALDEATFERELARRFQYAPPDPPPPRPDDPGAGLAEDAAYFAAFPDLDRSYAPAARERARQLIARLEVEAPRLSREQFLLRVAEITALADNAHTCLDIVAFWRDTPRLPLRTYLFSDGLRVLRAKGPVEDLVGASIDTIEGRSVDELFRGLAKYQGGPDARRRHLLTPVLESPAFLEAAGLARESHALTIAGILLDGRPFERRIEAEARGPDAPILNTRRLLFPPETGTAPEGMTAWLRLPTLPVSLADDRRLFLTGRLPDGGLYVQLGHNNDGDEEQIAPFLESVLAEIERLPPTSLVLDLRFDGGGDYTKTWAFARALPARLPPDARIWLLTAPWTFSAGITTAAALVDAGKGRVRIVGEEVGDRLVFWAEGGMMSLPNSRLQVFYAAGKHDYRSPCDDADDCFWLNALFPVRVESLEPHLRVPWRFEDYRAGRDAALDRVAAENPAAP